MVAITTGGFVNDDTGVHFALFYSSYLLFILFSLLFLIIDLVLLLLLLPWHSRASWLCDMVAEVKLWAVAEEDRLLTLVVKDGLLALPSGGLCQK